MVFKKIDINVPLTAEQVKERLEKNISSQTHFFQFFSDQCFFGKVSNKKIKLYYWKNKFFRNSFSPVFFGNIEFKDGKTRVFGRFSISKDVIIIFFSIFLSSLLIANFFITIVLSLFLIILAYVGWRISENEQEIIEEFLKNLLR